MGDWLRRTRGVLFFALVAAILAGIVAIYVLQPRSEPRAVPTATPEPSPAPTPTPQPLRVYISGAVVQPDVYSLPPGSIVKDAILAAGGASDEADLDHINLALPLQDGLHVHVPREGEASAPIEPVSRQPGSFRINVNTASAAELESLPGIGPTIAQRIIEHRETNGPFAQIEELEEVSGIGPATLAELREFVTTD